MTLTFWNEKRARVVHCAVVRRVGVRGNNWDVQMTAFADLTNDTARMMKLREHLAHPLSGPVPAPWVVWLLSRTPPTPAEFKPQKKQIELEAVDPMLERIYAIAECIRDMTGNHAYAQRARRAGRRICNIIDQVDEALGLDGE